MFIVYVPNTNIPTQKFDTENDAAAEAKEIAKLTKEVVYVMRSVAKFQMRTVIEEV